MLDIAQVLASSAHLGPDGRGRLAAAPPLQSWPGLVHGGALVAVLDSAAVALGRPSGPRRLEGRLTASVPLATALDLEGRADGGRLALTISQEGRPLTSGTITALEPAAGEAAPKPWTGTDGWRLPMSEDCLACGARNPLGLQAALSFNGEGVWARLELREPWRAGGDRLHPALAPVLLDELAWWLGALLMKEGGLTNRITVTLLQPNGLFRGPLLAGGRFEDVKPIDRKRTFWRTETAVWSADGEPLATGSIVFRGGPDYARQMEFFRRRTPAEIFRRMFPNYAG